MAYRLGVIRSDVLNVTNVRLAYYYNGFNT